MKARLTAFFIFILMVRPAMAIEEPEFEVLQTNDNYEVRRYVPHIVAEVDVAEGDGDPGRAAFRILAGYIFGDNEAETKMSMTAPVTSHAGGDDEEDLHTYAFFMESEYTMATLPKPIDTRIRLVEKPARVIAARRYSGRWSTANYQKHEGALIAALAEDGVSLAGEPYLARYNSPFTPWFMRRNELLVEIEWPSP